VFSPFRSSLDSSRISRTIITQQEGKPLVILKTHEESKIKNADEFYIFISGLGMIFPQNRISTGSMLGFFVH
jgi:hypothetical protein